jgi:hypothetical protein
MLENNLSSVIDVGCGNGYKLVYYLKDFETLGIETEPCYTWLVNTYPDRKWFKHYGETKDCDLIICSDVIEHILDPDILLDYLISLGAKYYIISTPCREVLCNHRRLRRLFKESWQGPPINKCHVREWTMSELKEYLSSKFEIVYSAYCEKQVECQFHLLKIKE